MGIGTDLIKENKIINILRRSILCHSVQILWILESDVLTEHSAPYYSVLNTVNDDHSS